MAKRVRWARALISRHSDPDSVKGKREVGRLAVHHQVCGCFYCRYPKQFDIPSLALVRSSQADQDAILDLADEFSEVTSIALGPGHTDGTP